MKLQATIHNRRSRVVFYTLTPVLMAVGAWIAAAMLVSLGASAVGRLLGHG